MKKIIIFLKNIRKKIKLFINKLGSSERNKKINNKNVTIISNNCFAGITYEYLNLPYLSPTIGLYFFAPEYIKFISNLKYYATVPLEFMNINKSKYYDELVRIKQENVIIGKLDDIEIVFLHYNSFKEAKEKWEKRCKRINYDNIIFKFNDQNLCTEKELEQFNNLDLPNKICFTSKKHNNNGFIQIKRDRKRKCVRDDAFSYHKYFDIVKYINSINRKKRILHLLYSNTFSGAENVACQIIKNTEIEFTCFYCSPDGPIKNNLNEMNINYIPIKKLSIKEIKRVIKEINPDIIHAHDNKATVLCSLFGKKYKVVSHIHGNNKIMNTKNFKTILFNLCSKNLFKIIWVSDSSFDEYYFKNNVKEKSIILYNVVVQKAIEEKSKEYKCDEDFDLIFLGRLGYPKNPERLMDVIELVKQKKNDIRVAIVGDGSDRKLVEERIKEKRLNKNIKLFGFQSNPYPILRNSKILIMTSIYEGTPMCALEAQALGKPIVATPVDGLRNIIKNDYNGFLSDDNEELVIKILYYLDDKNYKKIVKNIQKHFKKINDSKKYFDCIKKIYNK